MAEAKYYNNDGIARALGRTQQWVAIKTREPGGIPVAGTPILSPGRGPKGRPCYLYSASQVAAWAMDNGFRFDPAQLPAPFPTPHGVKLGDPVDRGGARRPRRRELHAPTAREILDEDDDEELEGAAPAPGRVTKSEAELRAMVARAELTEAKARLLSGEYVKRSALRQLAGVLSFNTRQRFGGLPNKLSRQLARMTDQHEIHELLTREIDAILHGLAKTGLNMTHGSEDGGD